MTTQTHEHVVAAARDYLIGLQSRITSAIEAKDGQAKFLVDKWEKGPGEQLQGNGITQILENGPVFERAGCGFSHVRGPKLPPSATQHRPELAGAPFEAMGVSLVFHPRNPYVPTVHMNVRMLSAGHPGQEPVCWFGGGMDLTPYYGFDEDACHFHTVCRDAVQPFGEDKHPRFKQWCDDYFFLKHRNEPRGVGGGLGEGVDVRLRVPRGQEGRQGVHEQRAELGWVGDQHGVPADRQGLIGQDDLAAVVQGLDVVWLGRVHAQGLRHPARDLECVGLCGGR